MLPFHSRNTPFAMKSKGKSRRESSNDSRSGSNDDVDAKLEHSKLLRASIRRPGLPKQMSYRKNKSIQPSLPRPVSPLNNSQIKRLLKEGYSKGLADSINNNKDAFGLHIWLIDNSLSMGTRDGNRIIRNHKDPLDVKMVKCSRWEEICECVRYHIQLARSVESPTSFRLLNYPGNVGTQQFSVCENPDSGPYDEQNALNIMRKVRPKGCTPIASHLIDIYHEISKRKFLSKLQANNQKVALIIATDGLPTDDYGYDGIESQYEFIDALKLLEGLPVNVIIRLCTDEAKVVDFYNTVEQSIFNNASKKMGGTVAGKQQKRSSINKRTSLLNVEVLDDLCNEAEEVHRCNPWLNYALPLHRMREMGYYDPVFDLLDERALTIEEVYDFCILLLCTTSSSTMNTVPTSISRDRASATSTTISSDFDTGSSSLFMTSGEMSLMDDDFSCATAASASSRRRSSADNTIPDPTVSWIEFSKHIEYLLRKENLQWNPMTKKVEPWIDMEKLDAIYGS